MPNIEFALVHQQGEDTCPQPFPGEFQIANTGESDMEYTVSDPGALVIVDGAISGTLAPGASVSMDTSFSCEDFSVGSNAASLDVSGVDVPTDANIGTVMVTFDVEVLAPVPDPGEFAFSPAGNPTRTKTHTIGSSPCPDPFSPFSITNTGGSPIEFMFNSPPSFLNFPSPASGVIDPGEVIPISTSFRCNGYSMGLNTGALVIETSDPDSNESTGTGQVNYQLTVQD